VKLSKLKGLNKAQPLISAVCKFGSNGFRCASFRSVPINRDRLWVEFPGLRARLIYTLHKLRIMKKLISVFLLIFVFNLFGQAARIITGFDIARWYLDADLVLICDVKETDTLTISRYDSLFADGFNVRYNIIREKYQLSIDSIIKGGELISGTMDTIFTPDFSANYSRTREW
jgi:hypothetical protein